MKDNWKSILIALSIFCAGLVTGILTQHPFDFKKEKGHPPFPPHPDFHAMQEFGKPDGDRHRPMPALPPEVKAYEEKIQGIVDIYRKKIREILTPTQKSDYDKLVEEHFMSPKGKEVSGNRFEDGPRRMPPVGPLRFAGMIIYKPVLEHLTRELKLDEKQKAAIQAIMEERRAELIKFVDTTPPPTLKMTLKHDEGRPRHDADEKMGPPPAEGQPPKSQPRP